MNILALLQCTYPTLSKTDLRRLSRIIVAMIAMTGRVTMLSISRWAGKGGSYRTVQRFFSSLLGKTVSSIAIFALSLINVNQRHSYPSMVEQVIRTQAEKEAARARTKKRKARKDHKAALKGKRGRPKGSKNRDKTKVELTPELVRIQNMVRKQISILQGIVSITYLALDGHFGNNNALQMVRQCDLHLPQV